MQALIDFIIRNLMALWPVAVVMSWQQGLRVRFGIAREELAPGVHWRWPFADRVVVWPATEITVDLPVGAVTTTDGRSIAISANLSYRLTSLRVSWLAVHDLDNSLRNLALGIVASSCAQATWASLTGSRSVLESRLATEVNHAVCAWGIGVTRVHLTDLVQARQYRLIGDQARAAA